MGTPRTPSGVGAVLLPFPCEPVPLDEFNPLEVERIVARCNLMVGEDSLGDLRAVGKLGEVSLWLSVSRFTYDSPLEPGLLADHAGRVALTIPGLKVGVPSMPHVGGWEEETYTAKGLLEIF